MSKQANELTIQVSVTDMDTYNNVLTLLQQVHSMSSDDVKLHIETELNQIIGKHIIQSSLPEG